MSPWDLRATLRRSASRDACPDLPNGDRRCRWSLERRIRRFRGKGPKPCDRSVASNAPVVRGSPVPRRELDRLRQNQSRRLARRPPEPADRNDRWPAGHHAATTVRIRSRLLGRHPRPRRAAHSRPALHHPRPRALLLGRPTSPHLHVRTLGPLSAQAQRAGSSADHPSPWLGIAHAVRSRDARRRVWVGPSSPRAAYLARVNLPPRSWVPWLGRSRAVLFRRHVDAIRGGSAATHDRCEFGEVSETRCCAAW